jgi:large subunit ribosomal protein L18
MSIYRPTTKKERLTHRHRRVRSRVKGTAERPRLSVFKSSKFVYAQLIDDTKGATLLAVHERDIKAGSKGKSETPFVKVERATKVGEELAKQAASKKITKAVFDRGGFRYTGRVKAVAEGARSGGLEF